ncbi:MAG: cysteine desulfurase family protein [Clostridia bacterium]
MNKIFLDNASTTKVFDDTCMIMNKYLKDEFYNPGAVYLSSFNVSKDITEAKNKILKAFGAVDGKIIITGSASEANNMVLRRAKRSPNQKIIISMGEHPSVFETARSLEVEGNIVEYVPITKEGISMIDNNVALVSIMHVSNETGAINNIKRLCELVKTKSPDTLFHSDGVQAFGKIPVNVDSLGVDFYTISAHKINGPKGIGALYVRNKNLIKPLITGGGQEDGFRAGTENVPQIMAFSYVCEQKIPKIAENYEKVLKLRNSFVKDLLIKGDNIITINSPLDKASPYILSISAIGCRGEVLLHSLESYNIYLSTGSACSAKVIQNRILNAMGKNREEVEGNLRISFNSYDEYDIEYITDKIIESIKKFSKHIRR